MYEKLPPVLDVTDIKQFLGIGLRQAYDLVNSGQFHSVRVGRRIKVSKNRFIEWFEGDSKIYISELKKSSQ